MPALARKTEGVALKMSGDPSAGGTTMSALVKSRHLRCKKACPLYPQKPHPIRSSRSRRRCSSASGRTHRTHAKKIKRLAERVLSQKAVLYMFQSATEAANWIRSRESQTWPRATDAINL